MKIKFWLLDVNSEVEEGASAIWIWGIDPSGKRILIVDKSFVTYFYVVVEENADPSNVVRAIEENKFPSVSQLEVVERRFFGKPVKTVKVYCRNSDAMPKHAKTLRKLEGVKDCLEEDIRYSMRYLIDNNVVPCAWHEIEVTEEKTSKQTQVVNCFTANSPPKHLEETKPPPSLRIMGFSPVFYSKEGSPKPNRNPVVIISVATNEGEEKQFSVDESKDDKTILKAFMDYVSKYNPDIIVSYGGNGELWPYLIERCRRLGLRLSVDRTKGEPHTSVYSHVSLTGRVSLDLADYADEFPEVKVKTLENLADYLGVMKLEDRNVIEDVDLADYWDDKAKRKDLMKFSSDNVYCVMGITDAVLDFAIQLSILVGLPLDHVGTAAAGFRVEWFMIRQTRQIGELVPKRIEQPYRPYAGGLVLQPKRGLHENIAVLDFKSMYPNLMIAYNLSPDTYISAKESVPPDSVYEAPEVKHHFRKSPPGFYKEILTYLISARDEIRSRMKKLVPSSVEYRVLNARQKAVKVITNATYGYAGWIGARWYMKPVAEAAAAWGRHTIQTAIKIAEEEGLEVVYGDTDSVFVTNEHEEINAVTKKIRDKLCLDVDTEKVYVRILFTEAKKRYAGLLPDGRLDIVGLEVMRGDWAAVAKNVQEEVLEIILKDQSPQKAAEFVRHFIADLRQKQVSYRDLVIWKTLTKPVKEYQVKASHVEAARMLAAKGWALDVGDKVGYVIVSGEGRLYTRVKPYVMASYDEVDIEYYVLKQVVPAAVRVLELFGITEDDVLKTNVEKTEGKKLTDFLSG